MFRKLCCALTGVVAVFAFTATPATAMSPRPSGDSASRTALPYHGHYRGQDAHGRHVSFSYFGTQMSNFMVNHHAFGGAHVSGDRWHHTCHNGKCTRGHWETDVRVVGTWNDPNSGHEVHFEAHLFAH